MQSDLVCSLRPTSATAYRPFPIVMPLSFALNPEPHPYKAKKTFSQSGPWQLQCGTVYSCEVMCKYECMRLVTDTFEAAQCSNRLLCGMSLRILASWNQQSSAALVVRACS